MCTSSRIELVTLRCYGKRIAVTYCTRTVETSIKQAIIPWSYLCFTAICTAPLPLRNRGCRSRRLKGKTCVTAATHHLWKEDELHYLQVSIMGGDVSLVTSKQRMIETPTLHSSFYHMKSVALKYYAPYKAPMLPMLINRFLQSLKTVNLWVLWGPG